MENVFVGILRIKDLTLKEFAITAMLRVVPLVLTITHIGVINATILKQQLRMGAANAQKTLIWT